MIQWSCVTAIIGICDFLRFECKGSGEQESIFAVILTSSSLIPSIKGPSKKLWYWPAAKTDVSKTQDWNPIKMERLFPDRSSVKCEDRRSMRNCAIIGRHTRFECFPRRRRQSFCKYQNLRVNDSSATSDSRQTLDVMAVALHITNDHLS